jgi:hypothetical protein
VLYLLIVISHLSGQPEDFTVLAGYDRELACQDAREDYLRVSTKERDKAERAGRHDPLLDRHERVICTGPAADDSACARLGRLSVSGRGASETPEYQDAYRGCRLLLRLE